MTMKTGAMAFLFGADTALPSKPSGSLAAKLKLYFRVRSDLRRLKALDDRMLADIGLSRSDVDIGVVRDGLRD
jgi:uncharacterized protein YjiS (DUF1127 family)